MTIETKEIIYIILSVAAFIIAGLLAITGKFIWKVAEGYENSIKELNLAWGKNNSAINSLAKSMDDLAKEMRADRELTDRKYSALEMRISENHEYMLIQDKRHDKELNKLRIKSHEYGNDLSILLMQANLKERAERLSDMLKAESSQQMREEENEHD